MIVRIMGEGQVELADSHFTELNKLDDELLAEIEGGDEGASGARWEHCSKPCGGSASRCPTTRWSRPS